MRAVDPLLELRQPDHVFGAFDAHAHLVTVVLAADRRLEDFGQDRTQLLVVVRADGEEVRSFARSRGLSVALLADAGDHWRAALGVPAPPDRRATEEGVLPAFTAVLIDRRGRAAATYTSLGGGVYVDELLERTADLDADA